MSWRRSLALALAILFAHTEAEATELQPRAVAVSAPWPDYPIEARWQKLTGAGVAEMEVDIATGVVIRAFMSQSTGSVNLDQAALNAFRQWKFKPGTVSHVRTPIRFTLGGAVTTEMHVEAKPMDEVLARFLGKGTVLKGPMPRYPRFPAWTDKQGKGVYELHVGKDGKVPEVKILKTSGDPTFDRIAVGALRKWRLTRGPLIIELPLSFTLTSTKYSVDIPKDR